MCMRPPSHVQHTTPTRTYWREASFVVLLGSCVYMTWPRLHPYLAQKESNTPRPTHPPTP